MAARILFISLAALILSSARCNRNRFIPYVPVDFELNLNLPAYQPLTSPSGWITVSGGSRGIIIYRLNMDEFIAYDRHSTFEVDANCQVRVEDDNILITDPCSGSQWLIIDGSVVQGPAELPLQRYQTFWNPPILRVVN
jgi:hypothetical protein